MNCPKPFQPIFGYVVHLNGFGFVLRMGGKRLAGERLGNLLLGRIGKDILLGKYCAGLEGRRPMVVQ